MNKMNINPEVSTESRIVSKREIALGLLSKPTYKGDYSCERFLNQNEEVTFQLFNGKSDFNAEFSIDGKPNRRIWLSQLNRVYLDADELELQCGVIRFKNGEQSILAGMLVNDFLEATRGRTFQVHVINGLFAIDFWDDRCQALGNAGEVRKYISKAFDEERYKDVEGMTKSMPCYCLVEL